MDQYWIIYCDGTFSSTNYLRKHIGLRQSIGFAAICYGQKVSAQALCIEIFGY